MTEALKPCPFCGGEPIVRKAMGEFWLRCEKCRSDGPMLSVEAVAIERWNTRARSEARPQQEAKTYRLHKDRDGKLQIYAPTFNAMIAKFAEGVPNSEREAFHAALTRPAPPLPAGSGAAREQIARIIELAIMRHGGDECDMHNTLDDADAILALASPLILGDQ